jgi:retinol dehydrogenase 12
MASIHMTSCTHFCIHNRSWHKQGHALLTKELLPTLTKTAAEPKSDVRIINLCSEMHKLAPRAAGFVPEDCQTDMASYSTWTRYGQSKLANILFTTELARRYPDITCVAIHPGGVATNLIAPFIKEHPYLTAIMVPFWKVFATGASQGAWNQTWASTAPVAGKAWTKLETKGGKNLQVVTSGAYYTPVAKEGGQTNLARDPELAGRLWAWTEEQLKERGY